MSTRSVIARTTGEEGGFKGVYHHWDGNPTGLGQYLWQLLKGQYHGDLSAMLKYVIDQHSAGWSTLFPNAETGAGECYCHPGRKRKREPMGNWFTDENIGDDIEWVYVFDEEPGRMYVRDTSHDAEEIVELNGAEPDWLQIECGKDLERCHHYAYVHFPAMKGSRLSTAVYLGRRDFDFHDAVAVIKGGKRYKMTGSGSNSSYTQLKYKGQVPPNTWISSVVTGNGRRMDMPTAVYGGADDYQPFPGVTWVFPPIKDTPHETFRPEAQ